MTALLAPVHLHCLSAARHLACRHNVWHDYFHPALLDRLHPSHGVVSAICQHHCRPLPALPLHGLGHRYQSAMVYRLLMHPLRHNQVIVGDRQLCRVSQAEAAPPPQIAALRIGARAAFVPICATPPAAVESLPAVVAIAPALLLLLPLAPGCPDHTAFASAVSVAGSAPALAAVFPSCRSGPPRRWPAPALSRSPLSPTVPGPAAGPLPPLA